MRMLVEGRETGQGGKDGKKEEDGKIQKAWRVRELEDNGVGGGNKKGGR